MDTSTGYLIQTFRLNATSERQRSALRNVWKLILESRKKASKGDARLHIVMKTFNPKTFVIEELARADDHKELSKLQEKFVKKFNSVRNGWNKVNAPSVTRKRNERLKLNLDGKSYQYQSLAGLCRELEISNSTVNHWRKKGLSLSSAVKKAQLARCNTANKTKIVVFRKEFNNVNELARSKHNKFNYSAATIRKKHRRGISYEDILLERPRRPQKISIKLNGEVLRFQNVREAHSTLSK